MADETPEMATWWQIRQRVIFTEQRLKALDELTRETAEKTRQNHQRADAAHRRIDEAEDTGALVKTVLERLEALETKVAKMAEWLKGRPWEKKNGEGQQG